MGSELMYNNHFNQIGSASCAMTAESDVLNRNYFKGKRALVTGAGRGIGRDVAKALWSAGAETYALSKTKENLDSLVAECQGIHPVCVDLSDWNSTQKALQTTLPIDLLVNNAGVTTDNAAPLLQATEADFDKVFSINVKAVAAVTQVVARKLIELQRQGSIVNVSSILSTCPLADSVVYPASKAALSQLSRCMAVELGPHQFDSGGSTGYGVLSALTADEIRVNAVCPTITQTDMTKKRFPTPESTKPVVLRTPLRRLPELQEITDVIVYLLSDKSTMIHGSDIFIDGGITQCALGFP